MTVALVIAGAALGGIAGAAYGLRKDFMPIVLAPVGSTVGAIVGAVIATVIA